MFCHSAERAIRYVRARRSPKAIETMRQAEFVIHYTQFISKKLGQQQQQQQQVQDFNINNNNNNIQMDDNDIEHLLYQNEKQTQLSPSSTTNQLLQKPLIMRHTDQTLSVPSVIDIGNLERSMCNNSL